MDFFNFSQILLVLYFCICNFFIWHDKYKMFYSLKNLFFCFVLYFLMFIVMLSCQKEWILYFCSILTQCYELQSITFIIFFWNIFNIDKFWAISASLSEVTGETLVRSFINKLDLISLLSALILLLISSWTKSPPWPALSLSDKLKHLWKLTECFSSSGTCKCSQTSHINKGWYRGWWK